MFKLTSVRFDVISTIANPAINGVDTGVCIFVYENMINILVFEFVEQIRVEADFMMRPTVFDYFFTLAQNAYTVDIIRYLDGGNKLFTKT